jgi:hypothetical protein
MAAYYEIRVAGMLPFEVLRDFERLSADPVPVETVLHGPLPDQAALAAFLTRLEDFGADVIEIRRLSQDTGLLLLPVQPVTQAPARQEQWTSDRSEDRCHV